MVPRNLVVIDGGNGLSPSWNKAIIPTWIKFWLLINWTLRKSCTEKWMKMQIFSLKIGCGCVSEMVVLPYSVIYYIYILGTLGLCFNCLCSVYWCSVYGICKRSDTLWPAGRVRLFAYYTISLSSLCRLIWRHWTNKMLVRYMLPCVCLRLRLFSQLSFIQYMGLWVFSLPN